MNYDKIMDRLKGDYELLTVTDEHDILGVFLYGSQNYEVDTEYSDIDTKAIIIPTVEEMIFGNTKTTRIIELANGELTVFDIGSIHASIKKQNINFLEILFTNYYIINPKYQYLWEKMCYAAETIARANEYAAVQCINGCIINKTKKIFRSVPSNEDRVAKYGYDNKALADVIRLKEFMHRYIHGVDYASCLISENTDFLIKIKTNPPYTVEEVKKIVEDISVEVNKMLHEYLETHEEIPNYDTLKFIDQITENCCKAYIKKRSLMQIWPSLSC